MPVLLDTRGDKSTLVEAPVGRNEEDQVTKLQIPHNTEAEEALLGSLIIDPAVYWQVRTIVSANDFYTLKNGWVFSAIAALQERRQPVDSITLCTEMTERQFDEVGGAAYITRLINVVPSALHAGAYASEVADNSARRSLLAHASDLAVAAHDEDLDPATGAARVAGKLLKIGKLKGATAAATEAMTGFYDKVEAWSNDPLGPGEVRGLATGLRSLDRQFGGLETGMYLLAGRTSMGKSATAIQIAANVAECGKRVLYFTLEMTKEQLIGRIVCARARVPWRDLKQGSVEAKRYPALIKEMAVVADWPLLINDTPSPTIQQIVAETYREAAIEDGDLELVLIDYLGLMAGGEGENRHQKLGDIARQVKLLSLSMDIPVMLLHQVGRGVEKRANKRPLLGDLFESGVLEQVADVVIFCYRDSYYYDANANDHVLELITRKDRLSGAVGTATVYLGNYAEVKDLERRTITL